MIRLLPGELLALLGYGSSVAEYRSSAGEAAALLTEADDLAKAAKDKPQLRAKDLATSEARKVRTAYERAAKAAAEAAAIAKAREREAVAVEALLRRAYNLHEQRVQRETAGRPPTPPPNEAV